MIRSDVKELVNELKVLCEALPDCSTLEPLEKKAKEHPYVFEVNYTRTSVVGETSEGLDIMLWDKSHISVMREYEDFGKYTLEVIPSPGQDYDGDHLIMINKDVIPC